MLNFKLRMSNNYNVTCSYMQGEKNLISLTEKKKMEIAVRYFMDEQFAPEYR